MSSPHRSIYAVCAVGLAGAAGALVAPGVTLVVMTLLPLLAAGEARYPAVRAWLSADEKDRFYLALLAGIVLAFDALALLLTVVGVPMRWWG